MNRVHWSQTTTLFHHLNLLHRRVCLPNQCIQYHLYQPLAMHTLYHQFETSIFVHLSARPRRVNNHQRNRCTVPSSPRAGEECTSPPVSNSQITSPTSTPLVSAIRVLKRNVTNILNCFINPYCLISPTSHKSCNYHLIPCHFTCLSW